MADWRSRTWASAEGLTLHARDYPAGEGAARLPVICLHGLTRNARDFDALAPWMAARERRVLAVNVRGRGRSAFDPAERYHLPVYADDVARLAQALGIGAAVFVGTSMGGLIAIEVAAHAPALVAAAVVNDVGPVLAERGLRRIGGYVGNAPRLPSWEAAADHLRRQNGEAFPHYAVADWARMAKRMFRADGHEIVADYDPAIARAFATAPAPADPWARWERLTEGRPVLLLRGSRSDLLAAETATAMRQGQPTVRFREVPNVGHAPMLDEPDALDAIGSFLDESP